MQTRKENHSTNKSTPTHHHTRTRHAQHTPHKSKGHSNDPWNEVADELAALGRADAKEINTEAKNRLDKACHPHTTTHPTNQQETKNTAEDQAMEQETWETDEDNQLSQWAADEELEDELL